MFEDLFRKRFQSVFAGDHRARAALLFVRCVQIFERGQGLRGIDGGAQFIGQFALLFDGSEDGGAAFVQPTQAGQFIGDDADLLVIERAGHLLAVTGDKRDGVAFIQ